MDGESSRCGEQVFGSRVTTSTLAGEYVTARDYVGGRASCGKIETSTSCTRRGIREKLWCMTYVLSKRGQLIMELGVVMTRQNFGFPCSPSCSVVCARAMVEVDTSAGRLSEAKTQRRPRARERVRGGVSFVVSLFLYLSFSRAGEDT